MRILRFAELESTNDEITRRAIEGAPDGLWVMADSQTKGRGRRGRTWVSGANGNLYCSGLVRLLSAEPPAQQLSFVAALAVHEVLHAFVPEIRLKWPNDVLVDGAKLSGILLESGGSAAMGLWLVVGIGINLAAHPDDAERPATNVATLTGVRHDPEKLLESLASAFTSWRQRWREGGFSAIRPHWLAASHGLGQPLVARLGQKTFEGVFAGLGDDGALLLRLESGEMRSIHAGEVFGI
jgi:BirA family transcriptional regulator, biotin operon repressor / biotin---[acetyl-CoA-carboxylase] ligase